MIETIDSQGTNRRVRSFMMCLDKEDLYERAGWDGSRGISRRQLLEHLQGLSEFRLSCSRASLTCSLKSSYLLD